MRLLEGVAEAAEAVRHNKLRTILSLLGMIIGTASVVAVMAAGSMLGKEFIDEADSIGARLIVIYRNWELMDWQTRSAFMSNRDVAAMKALRPDAEFIRVHSVDRNVLRGAVERETNVYGVDSGYWNLWPKNLASGRFLTESDETTLAKVAILTQDLAEAFFPDGDAIGSYLTIGSFDYLVVGVIAPSEKESLMNDGSERETIFLPYSALERTIDWSRYSSPRVYELHVRAASMQSLKSTAATLEDYLIRTYGTVDGACRFKVEMVEGALKALRSIFSAVTAVVSFIAGISLLVSGIGIMNVMLVAVAERTREIGVRKAIGARSTDILIQFLVESLFVCFIGGLFGVALGTLIARAISALLKWTFYIPLSAPFVALSVSAAVGLFFGLAPALGAARLAPVEALSKD